MSGAHWLLAGAIAVAILALMLLAYDLGRQSR